MLDQKHYDYEYEYLDLLEDLLETGVKKGDRTGTGTRSIFAPQLRFDLASGFPLLTTKKMHMKSIIHELLWFIRGETNVRSLQKEGVTIWNEWANGEGDLGPVYGKQWRRWEGVDGTITDQLGDAIRELRLNPNSRRIVVSAWNPGEIDEMALPPCHLLFQFYVADGKLSCSMYQRSGDYFLGVPFNIASYALLTMMVAQVTRYELGELVVTVGDCHLYDNHVEQAREQIAREPRPFPKMIINPDVMSIDNFKFGDFTLLNYNPHPAISAPVAV